jgi:hypothetical protein
MMAGSAEGGQASPWGFSFVGGASACGTAEIAFCVPPTVLQHATPIMGCLSNAQASPRRSDNRVIPDSVRQSSCSKHQKLVAHVFEHDSKLQRRFTDLGTKGGGRGGTPPCLILFLTACFYMQDQKKRCRIQRLQTPYGILTHSLASWRPTNIGATCQAVPSPWSRSHSTLTLVPLT